MKASFFVAVGVFGWLAYKQLHALHQTQEKITHTLSQHGFHNEKMRMLLEGVLKNKLESLGHEIHDIKAAKENKERESILKKQEVKNIYLRIAEKYKAQVPFEDDLLLLVPFFEDDIEILEIIYQIFPYASYVIPKQKDFLNVIHVQLRKKNDTQNMEENTWFQKFSHTLYGNTRQTVPTKKLEKIDEFLQKEDFRGVFYMIKSLQDKTFFEKWLSEAQERIFLDHAFMRFSYYLG